MDRVMVNAVVVCFFCMPLGVHAVMLDFFACKDGSKLNREGVLNIMTNDFLMQIIFQPCKPQVSPTGSHLFWSAYNHYKTNTMPIITTSLCFQPDSLFINSYLVFYQWSPVVSSTLSATIFPAGKKCSVREDGNSETAITGYQSINLWIMISSLIKNNLVNVESFKGKSITDHVLLNSAHPKFQDGFRLAQIQPEAAPMSGFSIGFQPTKRKNNYVLKVYVGKKRIAVGLDAVVSIQVLRNTQPHIFLKRTDIPDEKFDEYGNLKAQ